VPLVLLELAADKGGGSLNNTAALYLYWYEMPSSYCLALVAKKRAEVQMQLARISFLF
jgi:hypothetical protein